MNRLIKLGLVTAFAIGGASAAIAQDAAAGASGDVTGSIGGATNFGSLIATLQAGSTPDLTAFTDTSTINCVKVSTLSEDGANNAAALDSAVSMNQDKLTSLHSSIEANSAFMTKVESSCAVADLDVNNILAVEGDATAGFTVYLDDRSMAGDAMSTQG